MPPSPPLNSISSSLKKKCVCFFLNQPACPTFPQRAYFGLYMPQIICTAKMAQRPLVAGTAFRTHGKHWNLHYLIQIQSFLRYRREYASLWVSSLVRFSVDTCRLIRVWWTWISLGNFIRQQNGADIWSIIPESEQNICPDDARVRDVWVMTLCPSFCEASANAQCLGCLWSCSLLFWNQQLYWSTKKPHQKFCLWFTCTEFPAAVDEWGRVWWVSSDHDLQHTLGQFAIECEAAGMKVRTWRALPESGRKKTSFDLKASCCLRLTSWVLELVPPREEHQIWRIMGIYRVPQASEHLSYWFRPLQRHRWTDSLKLVPLFWVWNRDCVSLSVVFLM